MKQATLHVRTYVTSYGAPLMHYEVTVRTWGGARLLATESSANREVAVAAATDAAHAAGYEVKS